MLDAENVYKILKRINICIQYGDYDAAREYANLEMKNIYEYKNKIIKKQFDMGSKK